MVETFIQVTTEDNEVIFVSLSDVSRWGNGNGTESILYWKGHDEDGCNWMTKLKTPFLKVQEKLKAVNAMV